MAYVSSRVFRCAAIGFSRCSRVGQKTVGQLTYRSKSSSAIAKSLVGRNFLTLRDFSADEIRYLLWVASDLKTRIKARNEVLRPLENKSAALLFQYVSTRTRTSSETGFALLGGHACNLNPSDMPKEDIVVTANVLSQLTDIILLRAHTHADVVQMAENASVPVINGMSEVYHPLQILADLQTLQEHFSSGGQPGSLKGMTVAWVGDGNNILDSWLMAGLQLGINMRIANPEGYDIRDYVQADAERFSAESGAQFYQTRDPRDAVRGANVIVTDTWAGMGQKEEAMERLKRFAGYQVTMALCNEAAKDWVFLHCLPRQENEVTDEVFYSKHSLVFPEAGNRKWTVMAVMLSLLQEHTLKTPQPSH